MRRVTGARAHGVSNPKFMQEILTAKDLIEKSWPEAVGDATTQLVSLLEAFHRAETLSQRLDSLVALARWLRAEDSVPRPRASIVKSLVVYSIPDGNALPSRLFSWREFPNSAAGLTLR
jgi:hypothetical protein